MRFRISTSALLVVLCCCHPLSAQQDSAESEPATDTISQVGQVAKRIDVKFQNGQSKPFHFYQFLPEQYSAEGQAMPLMIFLHGRGECGDDLQLVKTWGPPKLVDQDNSFPFVVLSPQCPTPGWDVVALKGLLDHAAATLNVDSKRVYVTGLSMGGYGTWKFVAKHPELIAAAIPICGGGHAADAEVLKQVPIWAFHGDDDQVVPLAESQRMVDAIKDLQGEKVELSVYEGVGHNSWKQTYANPKIYEWLLKHERKEADDQ